MFEIIVENKFPAAHALRNYKGATEPIHGHNWRSELKLEGPELDACGLLADFIEVKAWLDEIISRLDHKFLNETPPFDIVNPSAENIAKFIGDEFQQVLKEKSPNGPVRVASVRVWETDSCSAVYIPAYFAK